MSLGECLNYLFILHSNCNVLYREVTLKKKKKTEWLLQGHTSSHKNHWLCVCLCVLVNFIWLTLLYWLKDYRRIGYVCYASHFNRIHLEKVKVLKRLRCIFLFFFFFCHWSHLYRHEKQTTRPWNLNGIGINASSPIICELFSWYELSTWAIIQLIWISFLKGIL